MTTALPDDDLWAAIRAQVCGSADLGQYPVTLVDQLWDALTDVQARGDGPLNGALTGGPQGVPDSAGTDVLAQLTGSPVPGQVARWGPTTDKSRAGWDGRYRTLAELADQLRVHAATLGADVAPDVPTVTLTGTAGDATVALAWSVDDDTDVTGWTVARDGTDTHGTGPWSADLPPTARAYTMSSLTGGASYRFTVTAQLAADGIGSAAQITATPTAAATPATPAVPSTPAAPLPTDADGTKAVSAAARLGWGAPLPESDEFDYTGPPDPAKWSLYDGPGHAGNGRRVAGAGTVSDGYLRQHGQTNGDTAGMASKRGLRYGRWEVRARIIQVGSSGHPYHPVLITWPDSNAWPSGGEYDYFEVNVGDKAAAAYLHHPTTAGVVQDGYTSAALDLAAWHNYGLDWGPDALVGYLDGAEWFRDTDPRVQAPGPMHQTIQLDNFYGAGGMCEAYLDVAWARVYAR